MGKERKATAKGVINTIAEIVTGLAATAVIYAWAADDYSTIALSATALTTGILTMIKTEKYE